VRGGNPHFNLTTEQPLVKRAWPGPHSSRKLGCELTRVLQVPGTGGCGAQHVSERSVWAAYACVQRNDSSIYCTQYVAQRHRLVPAGTVSRSSCGAHCSSRSLGSFAKARLQHLDNLWPSEVLISACLITPTRERQRWRLSMRRGSFYNLAGQCGSKHSILQSSGSLLLTMRMTSFPECNRRQARFQATSSRKGVSVRAEVGQFPGCENLFWIATLINDLPHSGHSCLAPVRNTTVLLCF
jgi:hypothetical protein